MGNRLSPIAHCPLPIAPYLSPIAYNPLPIAHCPSPIAYCLDSISLASFHASMPSNFSIFNGDIWVVEVVQHHFV